MKFKKVLVLFLVAAMVIAGLAGCSAKADPTQPFDWTEYDNLIAQVKSSTDFVQREALMHQAEDMLMETGAIVPIYYYNDIFMMKSDLKGFYSNPYGTKFFMYATLGNAKTLRLNLASEPARLDPALNSSVDGACLAAQSFAGLCTYNEKGDVVLALAKKIDVSADGLTYTITLKDNLKWSDGSDLTAADFEYSWKRAAKAETASDYAYMFNGIEGYGTDEGINVKAEGNVFTVKLAAPCAYFYDLCAFPTFFPVKQEAVEAAAGYKDDKGAIIDAGAWALEAGFVCNGAYVLESWTHDESMVYVKNPYYYDAKNVTFDKLEFMLSADDTAIYAAYRAGDLDFIDTVPNDEIQTLLSDPEFHIVDELGTYYVIFNVKSPLFAGKTVEQARALRMALSLIIDREYIIETCAQTGQRVATSYVPAAMLDGHGGEFKTNDATYTFPYAAAEGYYEETVAANWDRAMELFEIAGYEVGEDGKLVEPFSFEYLSNESSGHIAIAECLQQDMAKVGITMTIKTIDWDTFLEERKQGNYDVARNGWIADFNDPINFLEMWTTESGNNDAQFGRFTDEEIAAWEAFAEKQAK